METAIPNAWVPRDSDRIWRGSYKGKVSAAGWCKVVDAGGWVVQGGGRWGLGGG
jgi:hypothetical protein